MSSVPQVWPPITVLSGSTRFRREFRAADRALTLRGHIVLGCGVFSHAEYGATPREDAAWTVAEFNDAPGRTAAEVIEALHDAAGGGAGR